jgi:hypothetical protein
MKSVAGVHIGPWSNSILVAELVRSNPIPPVWRAMRDSEGTTDAFEHVPKSVDRLRHQSSDGVDGGGAAEPDARKAWCGHGPHHGAVGGA